jgi:hypothetical protein
MQANFELESRDLGFEPFKIQLETDEDEKIV